jgi:PPP family 3-phenylpropionic acid transporter
MTRRSAAMRFALYYGALFGGIGIQMPFWPVWLASRGLSASDIGLAAAAIYVGRMVFSPVIGAGIDRRGDRRRPLIVLGVAAALAYLLFAITHSLGAILVVSVLTSGLWGGLIPVGDSLALMACARWHLDYGRVRLWGSAAFIGMATLTGRVLASLPPSALVWMIAGAFAATAAACLPLPDLKVSAGPARRTPLRPLLTDRLFLLFLGWAALNQAAHSLYYAFATLDWRAGGLSDDTIGLLWSEGVVAEILLFALSGPIVRRLGPAGLLVAAALGGALRWTVMGLTTSLPVLVLVQLLHAATFGCAHLGSMHFLQRAAPDRMNARAQSIYAAVAAGAAPALMSPVGGFLYQQMAGRAFLIMALVCLGAALVAHRLRRAWDGGPLASA